MRQERSVREGEADIGITPCIPLLGTEPGKALGPGQMVRRQRLQRQYSLVNGVS